jgi:hypothetical protein
MDTGISEFVKGLGHATEVALDSSSDDRIVLCLDALVPQLGGCLDGAAQARTRPPPKEVLAAPPRHKLQQPGMRRMR